eukprot:1098635-Alexandrium_andersonii.AAC.1
MMMAASTAKTKQRDQHRRLSAHSDGRANTNGELTGARPCELASLPGSCDAKVTAAAARAPGPTRPGA